MQRTFVPTISDVEQQFHILAILTGPTPPHLKTRPFTVVEPAPLASTAHVVHSLSTSLFTSTTCSPVLHHTCPSLRTSDCLCPSLPSSLNKNVPGSRVRPVPQANVERSAELSPREPPSMQSSACAHLTHLAPPLHLFVCAGCGRHIDTALASVPIADRCQHKAATQAQQDEKGAAGAADTTTASKPQ